MNEFNQLYIAKRNYVFKANKLNNKWFNLMKG